jgi:squalene cyclase
MEPSEELILRQGHERRDACRLIREMGEDLEMPTACSSAALVIYHAYRQVCTERALNLSEPRESRETSQAYVTTEEKNEKRNFAGTTPIVKQDYMANVFSSCLR